jgi:hypothetical protein
MCAKTGNNVKIPIVCFVTDNIAGANRVRPCDFFTSMSLTSRDLYGKMMENVGMKWEVWFWLPAILKT